jgi:mannose-6-phosphate isomerase-like protein (cupin superfamily)
MSDASQRPTVDLSRVVVGPDDGKVVHFGRAKSVRFIVTGEQTGGHYSIVEHPVAPGFVGAPYHTHHGEDQYSYVLYGSIQVLLGDEVVDVPTGGFVYKPRGLGHAFWNPGPEPAAVLELVAPGGFEMYFAELAELFESGRVADPEVFGALTAKYNLELDVSSFKWLPERFGLVTDDPRA